MKGYSEIEVFKIEDGFAYISFKDDNWKGDDPTNGYSYIKVPLKERELQLSVRGNILVDQSEKNYEVTVN